MDLSPNRLLRMFLRKDRKHLRLIDGIVPKTRRVTTPLAGLWERHDSQCEIKEMQKGATCVVGFAKADTVMLHSMLRQIGLGPCASCLQVETLDDLASVKNVFNYLLVNIDAFEDSDVAVAALMDFRDNRDEIVVILVSTKVASDDLGPERRMICDATLRAPITLSRLRRGVASAFENNDTNRRRTVICHADRGFS